MLNKRIRSLIDEIFSEMKMTAENLALRDELMANAQARFDDAVSGGMSEEDAFREVASSLGDVQALLAEMNGEAETAPETESAPDAPDEAASPEAADEPDAPDFTVEDAKDAGTPDIGEALNKAFSALGDFGRQIVPQAKKLVKQVDDATGGAIDGIGKTVEKGLRDAQRAAEELLAKKPQKAPEAGGAEETRTPEQLREDASQLRAQAELKEAAGDQEGARRMRADAYAMENSAEALEQAEAIERARRDAERASAGDEPPEGADAFDRAVNDVLRDAEEAARETSAAPETGCEGEARFPAAGLRGVDVKVDADDVAVEACEGAEIVVRWSGMEERSVPVVQMAGHTLTVRRPNPDVFKTFFSVFSKDGGSIQILVPKGYAADYAITTTSGDVLLRGVDADGVKVNTTSGDVRVEPDNASRLNALSVATVSGDATVSALAGDISVDTVSGEQFISCDAGRVDVNAVSGDVHIEGASDEIEVSLVSGDAQVLCTVAPTKRIHLSSISGDVRVALPGDVRGFVAELSGMGGHVENEFGPNRYGTCALPIHMDTMSGTLAVTRL